MRPHRPDEPAPPEPTEPAPTEPTSIDYSGSQEEIDAAKRPQEKLQSNTSISGMREPQKEAPLPAVLRA